MPAAEASPVAGAAATAILETPTVPALVLSAKTSQESSEKPKYTVEARWPYLEWGADPRVKAFNQAAESFVNGEIQSFKGSVQSLPDDPLFSEYSSTLKIDFMPTSNSNGIIAILFQISFYSAGAAHPGHYSHALNYDLRAGKVLSLDDIFLAGYLDMISSTCLSDLKNRGVLEWEDGAQPVPENYQVWNITPEGLLITFDEYQVASYAAGPQSVMVPKDILQPLLRPDGPLAGYYHP